MKKLTELELAVYETASLLVLDQYNLIGDTLKFDKDGKVMRPEQLTKIAHENAVTLAIQLLDEVKRQLNETTNR